MRAAMPGWKHRGARGCRGTAGMRGCPNGASRVGASVRTCGAPVAEGRVPPVSGAPGERPGGGGGRERCGAQGGRAGAGVALPSKQR